MAKVLVTGKSKVEIGELGADYSANAKFWWDSLAGPDIKIKGAAKIEMLGKASEEESDVYNYGVPVVSMRGNCLIDMCDTISSDYLGCSVCYQSDVQAVRKMILGEQRTTYGVPFTTAFAARNAPFQNAPILQMKGRAILTMVDEALLQMRDSSYALFEGNAYFKVSGGGYRGSNAENLLFTHTEINAGSVFILDGGNSFPEQNYSVLAILGNQIMLSNAGKNGTISPSGIGPNGNTYPSSQHGDVISSVGYDWNGSLGNAGRWVEFSGVTHDRYDDTYALRKIGFSGDLSLRSSYNSFHDNKQSVLIEGTTRIKIGGTSGYSGSTNTAGSSTTIIDIGGYNSAATIVNLKAGNNGGLTLDYGTEYGASYMHNVQAQSGSQGVFNFQVASGKKSEIFIEAQGNTCVTAELAVGSIYGPSNMPALGNSCFGVYLGPARTDIDMKWQQLQAIWNGYNHFLQVDGETHVENWSGKIVIRSSYDDIFNPTHGTCYPYFEDKAVSFTPTPVHKTDQSYQVKNPNYPIAISEPPTAQDIGDYFYKYDYSKPKYNESLPWGVSCTYSGVSNVQLGDERTTGAYYYIKVALSNYKVKEGNITITFKDSTEYTTLEDLSDAIAAHPEKFSKQWTNEEVIGFSAGTLGTRTQVTDGWQYTISNATSIRRQKSSNPWQVQYYYGKENFDSRIAQYSLWPITAGMTLNQLPTGFKSYITQSGSSCLNQQITYISQSNRGIGISNLIYTDVVVDVAYVEQPYYVDYDVEFTAESLEHVDWLLPSVQQSELLSGPYGQMWNRSPIVQLRDPANISIHGKFNTTVRYYSFTTSEIYDVSDMAQAVSDFINGPDYDGLLEAIDGITLTPYSNYKTYETELWKIIKIVEGSEAGHYTIHYTVKPKGWNEYIESTENCPVVEITDDSEIRLYDGAIVKGYRPDFGETTFEFKSSDSSEEPVSFTLSELKALKQMLNNI